MKDRLSFGSWGNRRSYANTPVPLTPYTTLTTETVRGYTGHEHGDAFGIIHMNGRIYDPNLGRMLQADPFIQSPTNTQSYNRYSYVLNNPLIYTDPSGYFSFKESLGFFVAIAGTIACGGNLQCGMWGYSVVGGLAGGVSAAANGNNFMQGAVVGGISGAAFYGIADTGFTNTAFAKGVGDVTAARFIAFGAVGGVANSAQGGSFGHGFVSAGIGGSLAGPINGVDDVLGRVVLRALVAGTVSELTGGKFANGAATAAFASIVAEGAAATSRQSSAQDDSGRTTAELRHKNIPGGDALGNTNPDAYPQHGYVIVRDNLTGEEWISRAGPGGEGGNAVFGSIKAITRPNVPGSSGDYGAQVNYSVTVLTTDMAPQVIVDQLSTFTNSVNSAQISYNPITTNSNSFSYQAVEVITGTRPPTKVFAPGAQTVLRVH